MITLGIDPAWDKITIACVSGDREQGYNLEFAQLTRIPAKTPLHERLELWESDIRDALAPIVPQIGHIEYVALEIPDSIRGWKPNSRALMKLGMAAGFLWGILQKLSTEYHFKVLIVDRTDRRTFKVCPTKEKAIAMCQRRGWNVTEHNRADACALALYAHQVGE